MRVRSVDVFRGLTMAGMVIVNNPGDWNAVYAPLLHAKWHGWTPTDLIFPFFLFIVGVAMALGGAKRASAVGVLRRGALLVGLGLLLAGFPFYDPAHWRVPGVLQRIGVCYVVASAVWRTLERPGDAAATTRRLAFAIAVVLCAYWALLMLVPHPGGAAGDLSPSGNLGAWLDRAVFGAHLWQPDWDPEGALGTMPAVATTICGIVAGLWIRAARPASAFRSLVSASAALLVAGLVWHLWFPINKSLWTSSYVAFTAGAGALILAVLHRYLDDGRASSWRLGLSEPFVALGRNALLLFVLSGLIAKTMALVKVEDAGGTAVSLQQGIYRAVFAPLAAPRAASLLFAVANLAAFSLLLAALHRRRWYWSV